MASLRDWLKSFSSDLNQPAFKAIVFAVLTLGTALCYWAIMLIRAWTGYCKLEQGLFVICRGDLQEEAWWPWLGFLAAGWGITFLDYRTKRQTSAKGKPADDALDGESPPPADDVTEEHRWRDRKPTEGLG